MDHHPRPANLEELETLVQGAIDYFNMSRNQLLIDIPLVVLEADLLVLVNCCMNIIHVVVHRLIHCLYSVIYVDLSLQLLSLMLTDKTLDLGNEFSGFTLSYEFRRLNSINEKLYLCQLEFSGIDMVVSFSPNLLLDDFDSKFLCHILEVIVDTLPLSSDSILLKLIHDLRHGRCMLVIGLLLHDLHEICEFELLVKTSRHNFTSQ